MSTAIDPRFQKVGYLADPTTIATYFEQIRPRGGHVPPRPEAVLVVTRGGVETFGRLSFRDCHEGIFRIQPQGSEMLVICEVAEIATISIFEWKAS